MNLELLAASVSSEVRIPYLLPEHTKLEQASGTLYLLPMTMGPVETSHSAMTQTSWSAQSWTQVKEQLPRSYWVDVAVTFPDRFPVRLVVPSIALLVSDEDRDGVFVVTDLFSNVYGEGEGEIVATKDYLANLFSEFAELERNAGSLAPRLGSELERMRRYLRRVE